MAEKESFRDSVAIQKTVFRLYQINPPNAMALLVSNIPEANVVKKRWGQKRWGQVVNIENCEQFSIFTT